MENIERRPPPPKELEGTRRSCLRCGTSFASEWSGERICKVCKGSGDWRQPPPFSQV